MIKKPATVLPPWEKENAKSGKYTNGSLVWYQKDKDSAGYAYKAKAPYFETEDPPDKSSFWEVDYTFAAPWSESGRYEIGARVYFFNGQNSYVYIASARYFGGSGPPNEEVDLDNIRTWEIEMDYNYTSDYYYTAPSNSEFLFPVRKHGGYTGDKIASFYPLDPEERPNIYPMSGEGSGGGMGQYFKDNNIIKEDYSDLNSVWQSYAYDTITYKFYSDKPDSNGEFIHEKKGLHAAQYAKKYGLPSDKYAQNGKKQFVYVTGGVFSAGTYFNVFGFSIEMWPTAAEGDYALIPSSGLKEFLTSFKAPLPAHPRYSISVDWYNSGSVYGGGTGGVQFRGDMRDPNGNGLEATPDEELVFDAYFYRTSPALSDLNGKMYFLKEDRSIYYKQMPIIEYDEDGNEIVVGYYYVGYPNDPTVSLFSESINSYDIQYRDDDRIHFTRTEAGGNRLFLTKYKKNLNYTTVQECGFKIE